MTRLHTITIILLSIIIVTLGIELYNHRPAPDDGRIPAGWSSDLAKRVDPKYAGAVAGFVTFTMSCGTGLPGVAGDQYLYAEFDINLKTGELRPQRVDMPAKGYTCPAGGMAAPRPAPQQAPAPTPPPSSIVPPAAKKP